MRENGDDHGPTQDVPGDTGKAHDASRRWHGGTYLGEAPATIRQELSIGGWGRKNGREPYGPPARKPTEH